MQAHPGLSSEIRDQFGQLPEIRLIIQPVTRNADGTPTVRDIAGHLIFDFKLAKQNLPRTGRLLPGGRCPISQPSIQLSRTSLPYELN